ncbi:MAG: twin-arginine translocation signal domain-containing protein, partial [Myxococcota bacterium]
MNPTTDRRRFLTAAGTALGGIALGAFGARPGWAQTPPSDHRFLFAYFEGGWDILLSLDPRNPATTQPDVHKIDPGYQQLSADYQQRGVQTTGGLRFGPIVPDAFLAHASDVTIINGVGMDTAAHEVGRRYFITGRFPRGISAVGSSTPAEILAQLSDD